MFPYPDSGLNGGSDLLPVAGQATNNPPEDSEASLKVIRVLMGLANRRGSYRSCRSNIVHLFKMVFFFFPQLIYFHFWCVKVVCLFVSCSAPWSWIICCCGQHDFLLLSASISWPVMQTSNAACSAQGTWKETQSWASSPSLQQLPSSCILQCCKKAKLNDSVFLCWICNSHLHWNISMT